MGALLYKQIGNSNNVVYLCNVCNMPSLDASAFETHKKKCKDKKNTVLPEPWQATLSYRLLHKQVPIPYI